MEKRNSTFSRRGDRSFNFCDHRLNASLDHEYLEFEEVSFLCDEVNNVLENDRRSSCFDKNSNKPSVRNMHREKELKFSMGFFRIRIFNRRRLYYMEDRHV